MSHCFLLRVFENVLAVTLASLSADRASAHWRQSELNNDQCGAVTTNNGDQHSLNIHNIPLTDETKEYFLGSFVKTDEIH